MVVLVLATLAFRARVRRVDAEHGGDLLGGSRDRRAHDDQDQRRDLRVDRGRGRLRGRQRAVPQGRARGRRRGRVDGAVRADGVAPLPGRDAPVRGRRELRAARDVRVIERRRDLDPVARPARGGRRRGRGDRGVVLLAAGHRHLAGIVVPWGAAAAVGAGRRLRADRAEAAVRVARLRAHRVRRVRGARAPGGARRAGTRPGVVSSTPPSASRA